MDRVAVRPVEAKVALWAQVGVICPILVRNLDGVSLVSLVEDKVALGAQVGVICPILVRNLAGVVVKVALGARAEAICPILARNLDGVAQVSQVEAVKAALGAQ
jgi:hypothetical protein